MNFLIGHQDREGGKGTAALRHVLMRFSTSRSPSWCIRENENHNSFHPAWRGRLGALVKHAVWGVKLGFDKCHFSLHLADSKREKKKTLGVILFSLAKWFKDLIPTKQNKTKQIIYHEHPFLNWEQKEGRLAQSSRKKQKRCSSFSEFP